MTQYKEATNETRSGKQNVHQTITDQIVASIEAGAGAFTMPWHRNADVATPTNLVTGNPYNGVNVIALWAAAEQRGFASNYWASYKQWRSRGDQVRKGEKGSVIVFYKRMNYEIGDVATDDRKTKAYFYARASRVFNAEQVKGWEPPEPVDRDFAGVLVETEQFVAATAANIRCGGDRAYYRPLTDHIQMPDRVRFVGTDTISATENYYATLLHEILHYAASRIMPRRSVSPADMFMNRRGVSA
jgi:antirestriction protein ArdC